VESVRVSETQPVHAGDVLATIDPADARLSVAQAQAQYGQAVRQVRESVGSTEAAAATIGARDADIARARTQLASAQSDLAKARIDLQRRQALSGSGAVSGEELTNARNAFQVAQINVTAAQAALAQAVANRKTAQGQLAAQQAVSQGSLAENPQVLAAKSALDTANLNLERTVLRAPIDGVIAKKQVEIGQRVAVGTSLMSVVPVQSVYVDANFKEVQLKRVRVGMPVEVTSDLYGGKVRFRGQVVGFSGGSGSAFAVIPAQNATGNWIKVVQRIPVRVALNRRDLRDHPLRVGLSMKVKINVDTPVSRQAQAPLARP
jgi:membrane fusion protein (multidrug efflux system)